MPLIFLLLIAIGCAPLEAEVPAGAPAAKVDILERAGIDPRKIAAWQEEYERFAKELDVATFAEGYPQTAKDLQAEDEKGRERGLRVCAASGDLRSIPLVVAQIRAGKTSYQVTAGWALEQLVSRDTLRRRDTPFDRIRIGPRKKGDPDLRPLRPVILDMLCSGEPNLQSYAATMVSYLNLTELVPVLRAVYGEKLPPSYPHAEHDVGGEAEESAK